VRTGAVTLTALLTAAVAVLLGPTGSAYAATTASAPAATITAPTPKSAPTPTTSPASTGTAGAGTAPKSSTKSTAKSTDDAKTQRAAAAREIQAGDPTQACSGAMEPRTVYACSAVPQGGADFTLTVAQPHDLLAIELVSQPGGTAAGSLTGPDGATASCQPFGDSQAQLRCPTDQAGAYTLSVADVYGYGLGFSVAYLALLSDTGCTAVTAADTALGAPKGFDGSITAGSAGECYTLPSAPGDVLLMSTTVYAVAATVYDATGTALCGADSSSRACALTGTAPYRVIAYQVYGGSADYTFTAGRLSAPDGCPTVNLQAYGTAPELSTAHCRILHVPADGSYLFGASGGLPGNLYRADGSSGPACYSDAFASTPCSLAAGDYTWAATTSDIPATGFALAFHTPAQTDGCTASRDDDFGSGAAVADLTAAGQEFCLLLPTASGNGLYLATSPSDSGVDPVVTVYDTTGAQQCQDDGYTFTVCKLTGTAPFHAVLAAPATGTYPLTVQRTGDTTGCTAWPQSAFGGSYGAQVALTAARQTACLAIPASGHSTAEMFDFTNSTNRLDASLQVYDAAGTQVCATLGSSTTTCRFTAGVTYAAVLVGTGTADTYDVVRRDVSSTASCAAPASLTVGGPSTGYTFTSALDARCLRVTAATADKLWFSVRTPDAAAGGGAELLVVNASGAIVCRQQGVACRDTGSTSYVVAVIASGYSGTPIAAHVDAWRVGTASGWAPQCTANSLSPSGFSLRSGTLTETSTAYCGVMQVSPQQWFNVYGTDSDPTAATPSAALFSSANWNGTGIDYPYQCDGTNAGDFDFSCSVSGPATQVVFIVSPSASATPVEYSLQGVCSILCSSPPKAADATSLSPASGPAGTQDQVVVHGTGLTLGTTVDLARNGAPATGYPMAQPVSVSADGTALTVLLNTQGLTPGTYDVVLDQTGYTAGVRSPGYLPGAYTVTAAATSAASRLVPVTPTRFLDTRSGTGAPKARVGAGGVVRLQVAGANGIPSTGVTAVVMNVTAVDPSTSGYVTVYPDGQPLPSVSNINFRAQQTIPNLVTVPVVNGKVDLRNAFGTVDLVADVTGYYTSAGTGSALTPLSPTRFLDTRSGTGAPKARVGAGGVVRLQVAGANGIPSTGVTAVVMNVTAVKASTSGYVTVYPDGQAVPQASNLNFTAGETIPNLVVVPVVNGKVDLRNAFGTVDLVADVTGYYTASGSTFSTAGPVRLLDTRSGLGARAGTVGPGGVVSTAVGGVDGVPGEGVTAVVLNVTVTSPTSAGYLTVYPHGQSVPGASNLNFGAGQTISNLVVVPVVDGRVAFFNHSGDVQVVADLAGYYSTS
jgi:hypothetical protein